MFSHKTETGEVVVEGFCGTTTRETVGIVAELALPSGFRFQKCTLMLICVAAVALGETQSFEEELFFGGTSALPGVAPFARNFLMHSGEWKGRAWMVKLWSRLPRLHRVAPGAVLPQLPLVRFPVAESTLAAQAQKGPVEILDLDLRAPGSANLCGIVASSTCQLAVFSFECETGLGRMIELLPVEGDEWSVGATMLHVAARAISPIHGSFVGAGVESCTGFHPPPNLRVTRNALEIAVQQIVAGCASEDASQMLMRIR
jgi:hypothetical protein